MSNRMDEISWLEFDQKRKETDLVIIPSGAVEVYGPHLPMGSDGIAAMAISEMIAQKINAVIAPLIPIGESSALRCFPGTLTISKEVFEKVIDEIFLQLIAYGFKNFLFVTGHAGNVDAISYYSRKYQDEYGIKCGQVDWWRFTNANGADVFELSGHMAHGHASECGTSVLLYLRPDLVDMSKATKVSPSEELYTYSDFIRYIPLTDKTDNSTVGDATIGTREKGERIVKKCVDRIVDYINYEFYNKR